MDLLIRVEVDHVSTVSICPAGIGIGADLIRHCIVVGAALSPQVEAPYKNI